MWCCSRLVNSPDAAKLVFSFHPGDIWIGLRFLNIQSHLCCFSGFSNKNLGNLSEKRILFLFFLIKDLCKQVGLSRATLEFQVYKILSLVNPISPGVLGPGNTPGGGHKVPTLNLRALNCCLTLKLCVCSQKYILTSQERKKIGPNLKKSVIFWDLKKFWIWDFVTTWLTKTAVTRSIFEIEGSYFVFFLIFMCLKSHI